MRKQKNRQWYRPSYFFEAFGAFLFLMICKMIGLDLSSHLGGALGARLGPLLKRDHMARENLKKALGHLPPEEIDIIINQMWRNLGRVIGEYAHLNQFQKKHQQWRLQVKWSPKARQAVLDHSGRCFFFSAHFTNWELLPLTLKLKNIPSAEIYQKLSNPYINFWIARLRAKAICPHQVEKKNAVRDIIRHIHANHAFAALVDQKMLSGVWVRFFSRPAQTSEFPASLALKQGYALIPASIDRIDKNKKTRFLVTIKDPLEIDDRNKDKKAIKALAQQMNDCLEAMIRERPDHWLWAHNRWS